MTVGRYLVTSGIAGPTEQDTVRRLDEFMTGALGWNRVDNPVESPSDRKFVWYSEGEEPGKYRPLWASAQASGLGLRFEVYTNWDAATSSGTDSIFDSTELHIPNNNSGGFDDYAFCGNRDVVFIATRLNVDGASYFGGFGYWDTFYNPTLDSYPAFVLGQNSAGDNFSNTTRIRSYGFDPDGFLDTVSTVSGESVWYVAQDRNFLTSLATPNPRDGRHLMLKQDYYTQRTRTDGGIPGAIAHEVRGEIPGLFQFSGTNFASFDRIVASGVSGGDAIPGNQLGEGDFLVLRGTASNAYTTGPLIDWNPFPPTVSGLELWMKGDSVFRRAGGHLSGGRVKEWIDLSGDENDAVQNTQSDQPEPIATTSGFNSKATLRFKDNEFLTGSLTYTNDYTAFVVANYSGPSDPQPLFYIRGDVGGDDNIFALEFNRSNQNQAEVTVQTTAITEIDVVTYSGLSENVPYIVSARVSGPDTFLYVNGDSTGSVVVNNTKTTTPGVNQLNYGIGVELDSLGSPTATLLAGSIAEVIVYSRDLSLSEHQSVICYLGNKYGVTVSGTC